MVTPIESNSDFSSSFKGLRGGTVTRIAIITTICILSATVLLVFYLLHNFKGDAIVSVATDKDIKLPFTENNNSASQYPSQHQT
jgi:hypothetical protein